ncbi:MULTISPECIES: DotU family type IV/VI secretion system protein [unclassified Neisseria]|uniref:DotU family type IV/VI secretion system protein n=1 Tax=unclassified Neisseria TaxID=2623750 RepID=UPI0026656916|nr:MULTISPECIES: DotU/TssL family secretion system protein [unclassified Neisseria]MDO1509043.1 DotU/TssL family secretion system protein [Neisseria sp. MVDL19-042950]MDO1515302.1 DotU/TssL family secretion system protein [Neisseria sp. MVDL18-041461]MDO1562662.1 DotU/TssL family secretion system protein [Neisseria sp. MVDL20-010259]
MNKQFLIRSSLRDTALAISALASGAYPGKSSAWHAHCKKLVGQFKEKLTSEGFSAADIEQLSYAQCALLDEISLKYLQGHERDVWEMEPLQVHFFQSYHAGDVLCDRIEELCKSASPNLKLAEAYLSIMNLGFHGRYVLNPAEADKWRSNLRELVNISLDGVETADGQFFFSDQKGTPIKGKFHINPLWVFVCCLLLAVISYFAFGNYLDGLVQQIQIKA